MIRAEWSPKKGFYKFGTKTQMLGEDHPIFGDAISLIRNSYEEGLSKVFREQKYQNTVAFFEYYGPNSFAGNHPDPESERKVTLIDVSPFKKGILDPNDFIDLFSHLGRPYVCYYGKANNDFVQQVKNSTLSGMSEEGVVCKGFKDKKIIMFKIKSDKWLDKLKSFCKDDSKLFEHLS